MPPREWPDTVPVREVPVQQPSLLVKLGDFPMVLGHHDSLGPGQVTPVQSSQPLVLLPAEGMVVS